MSRRSKGDRDHRQRLLDRFIKTGLAGFADYEILELILMLAIPQGDVIEPARELIAKYKDLRGILDAPIEELRAISGIAPAMPVALRIVRDVATVYLRECAEERPCLLDEESLLRFWRMRIGALKSEVFEVAYLDSAYRLMRDGVELIARGTINRTAVYPRTVMEGALKRGAAALVFAHNHAWKSLFRVRKSKMPTVLYVYLVDLSIIEIIDGEAITINEGRSRGAG